MNKTIKDFTDTELKAFAYDNLATIEQSQANLKTINEELARRAKEQPVAEVLGDKKTKK